MANRRMFSKSITNSSRFLMMPQSSQNLYFHVGMNADDDGFCEHFTIMRMTESKPDDLKVLQAKGFVKVFDDKVLIVLDWKENNYLRSDRYTPSKYLKEYKEELALLRENKEQPILGIPDDNQMDTKVRLGKDRLGKVNNSKGKKVKKYTIEDKELVELLHNTIIERYPHLSGKFNFEDDCVEMNKLHRLGKWSYEQIEYIARWSQRDDFWKQNILSVSKLRKQFDKLVIKAKGEQNKVEFIT